MTWQEYKERATEEQKQDARDFSARIAGLPQQKRTQYIERYKLGKLMPLSGASEAGDKEGWIIERDFEARECQLAISKVELPYPTDLCFKSAELALRFLKDNKKTVESVLGTISVLFVKVNGKEELI